MTQDRDDARQRVAITGVRVFDGTALTGPRTVVLEGGTLSAAVSADGAGTVVDGDGGTLLPGLVDAHVHLHGPENLEQSAQWGVTTLLDMATRPPALVNSLRARTGTSDIRSAGSPASAPGGVQTTLMGFDPSTALTGPADAERFVAQRADEGSDYIKVIVEDPRTKHAVALDLPTVAAVVEAAHARGLRVVAHATTTAAWRLALDAAVDVLTHAPVDADAGPELVGAVVAQSVVCVPTLTMMRAVTALGRSPQDAAAAYGHAAACVAALQAAGVPVLAGTDANAAPRSPAPVPHGRSLHDELALLVAAGLTPVQALRAATVLPARLFDLPDRGAVEPGRRADLLLVDGDPTVDIAATSAIRGVWAGGRRVR